MPNKNTARKALILLFLGIVIISGSLSSIVLFQHFSAHQIPVTPRSATTFGTDHTFQSGTSEHKVSYTSATFYAQLHPSLLSLQSSQTKLKAAPTPTASEMSSPTPTDHFSFSFSGPNPADATHGVPITICVSSSDDGAAHGEDVYLTASNEASFLTNLVTLDSSGCATSLLFTPTAGEITVYAGIHYITPTFNTYGGGDEPGKYALPAVASTLIDVTSPSVPIPPSSIFGEGRGSSPYAGESVNLALGNYIYQHTDFSLPVHGRSISMTRTYNSLDTSDGPFGVGWTFPYNQYLTFPTSTTVSVRYGDGHHEDYTLKNGIYTPVLGSGILSQLVKINDTYTVIHKDQTQDTYNASGQLISVSYRDENFLSLLYTDNELTTVYDPFSGRGLSFSYNGSGHIIKVIDLLDQTRFYIYAYNSRNQLNGVTDPMGYTTSYTYDNSNNLLNTVTDPRGNVSLTNVYDSSNRVSQQINALGATDGTTTFTYKPGITTVTDPLGHKTVYSFDFFYRQISVTNPLGSVTDYTYDNNGEMTTVTDGNDHTVQYSYDAMGNLESIIDAIGIQSANLSGHTTTYAYNDQNQLLEMVDANGNTTNYTYDLNGNISETTNALGGMTLFSYDSAGELVGSTSPDGGHHTTAYKYNIYGDQTAIIDGFGKTETSAYNPDGLPTKVTDADGHSIGTAYNADNRITSITDGIGNMTKYFYDQDGNRIKVIDARGDTTSYVYDALNRLIQINNPDGTTVQYFYDADGNLLTEMNGPNNVTTYKYNVHNQVMTITDALNHTTTYTYDGAGNVRTRTDGNGKTITYYYDDNNALREFDYSDNTTVMFTYDGVGNRLTMTDSTGTTRYTSDQLNRLISVVDPVGRQLQMSYDADGNLTSMVYPDSRTVTYNYDNDNRLASVTDWASRTANYSYDPAGNLIKLSLPNQIVTSYAYDKDNRLTGVSNAGPDGIISAFQYTLNAIGERTIVATSGNAAEAGNTTYSYDNMGRLWKAVYPDGSSVAYSYDSTGNRQQMIKKTGNTSTTTTYSYDVADELTQVTTGTTKTLLSYDQNGNLTSSTTGTTTISYQYNAQEELASVTNGTTSVSYGYNGDGFRTSKSITTGAKTTSTQYVLSPTKIPQVLEETSGSSTTDELYGLALLATDPMGTKDAPSYYSYDGIGSVSNVTDGRGNVLGIYSYDAFGTLRGSTGTKTEFQLNGQQVDSEDELIYLRSRYYDPTLGRFITRDSDPGIPDVPQTLNRYTYANDDPINLSDPTGKIGLDTVVFFIAGAIIGAVGSIISQAIQGKGINWGQVGIDAAIGGLIGASVDIVPGLLPEALAGFAPAIETAVRGTLGAIQGTIDYCFQTCGTSNFSWEGVFEYAGVGIGNDILFDNLEFGENAVEGTGELLQNLSSRVENTKISNLLYSIGDILTRTRVKILLGALPDGISGGVADSIEGFVTGDSLSSRLRQLNGNAMNN